MFAPWRSQNPVRKTWISDYWKIIHLKGLPQALGTVSQGNKLSLNEPLFKFNKWLTLTDQIFELSHASYLSSIQKQKKAVYELTHFKNFQI